jgi:hypothetical protein
LYYVTVSYATDGELSIEERREGVCRSGGAVRRREAPVVRLQDPADLLTPENRYRRGLDVVLATVQVENCVLAAVPSTAGRRVARVETQPFVAAGTTPDGATPWRLYPQSGEVLGVETVVDTSAAGFRTRPGYVAHVVGGRLIAGQHIVDGFPAVHDATATGFLLRVLMPKDLEMPPYSFNPDVVFTAQLPDQLRTALRWRVVWLGVEQ